MNNIKYFLFVQLLFSFCLCEISNGQKEKLLNGFKEYYNSLPNQVYRSEEESLLSTQYVDDTTYKIVVSTRVAEINNVDATKLLKCTATIKDSDNHVTIINNNCEEAVEQKQSTDENQETTLEAQVEVSEPTVERKPVQLVNEVQADTAITSGEQFIAIPRDQPSAPCVGCASHVNPQAAGVSDLANLGVRHLDLHEPSVKHSLDRVIDVERQVQVVNGVRYILTLSINSNHCTEVESENCASSKTCKITILVKPWVKLSNGGNYRAILANNCTEEWQYGDNGEVLPELSADNNQIKGNTSVDPSDSTVFDGDIQVKHNTNVESPLNGKMSLTDEDIKKIQDQIITNTQFQEVTESSRQSFTLSPDASDASKQHVFKDVSGNHNENSIPVTESEKPDQAFNINLDKKKAIDEMLDFFDFSGFKPKSEVEDVVPRVRRSYDYDLQVLSLAKDFHGIKNSIENARFMYEMAQAMVDYLNEMDMEVKNRAVKNVMRAEEETENLQRFVYVQASVTIPCDKVKCEPDTQICNGVIDCSNEKSPQILNTFCYNDNKDSEYREDIREISLDDPVLRKMAEEAVKTIESDSKSQYAMKINKIASAITQVTSGTLTKFSVIVENIKCNKSVPLPLRINCTVLEQLGSKVCDVIVHERHWLKEKKISYTCTERPADMRISKSIKVSKNVTVDDPRIIEMLQEAIQYLESQSDKTNKQKIVNVKSISSQIIAGFLTKIEFVVGYTDCTDENYSRDQINKCELVKGEGLRSCRAQIWDRSWIVDGRQIEVSCDDASKTNEIDNTRKKRSIDSASDHEQQSSSKDNDIDYKKLANESLYKFMQSSSSHQHYEVVKVDKTMVQDISRKLIKIDFSISPTDCLIENGILSSSECDIQDPKNILHCHSKILQNNWINKKQYFVKCNIKYQQKKNSNELKERNPSDSKYYQLAEESLAKYLHDTGNLHHIIVRVEKVTTQIVSGLLTRIDFIIRPKNDIVSNSKTVRCHSEILEKRWLETKAFNVSCQMKKKERFVKINTDNPKYMQIAVKSLQKYIKDKPESDLVRVAFVDKVEQKGDTIKIKFIASHAEEGDGDTFCYAEVSETSESKSDIEVKCHLIGKIYRKAEITEDDPNYNKYVQLADESLRNYLQKMNSSLYTLVSIESVTVQWDEGIKTLINFTISSIDSEHSQLIQGKQCIAEILEQPWLHKKNIDVKCELEKDLYRTKRRASNSRVRRQLTLGGVKEHDPGNPEYKVLAEESLRKYVVDSGITQPLQVAHIEKVTTQVVSGTLTRIDFVVSVSLDSETIKCHSKVWDRPWLNSKEINVSCQNDGHRDKRQLVGGPKDQDPTEPRYKALAEESLRKYALDSGITEPLEVVHVEKVTTQVVSGTVIRIDFLVSGSPDSEIIKCHSEVWDRPWLKRKDKSITVSCQNDGQRGKRQVDGGVIDQDPTELQYKALAEESLRKYASDSGISQPLEVARVERVTTQEVSGTLTHIDFVVSGSPDSETIKCHSEIWEQGWRNFKEIEVSCEKDGHRGKRQIAGGISEVDPTKPQYKTLAEESLRKYMLDSGITQPLQVARIEKVTTQVVSGTLTHIDFVVSGSPDSETIKCHSKVWNRPWLNSKEINVSCQNDSHLRGKRQLIGGPKDQDPTEPRYKALAEESLRKYAIDYGITEPLKVVYIEKVTTQVVSGTVTRIDFLVSSSPDSKTIKCQSEVWNRPWLKLKDLSITVSCESDGQRGKRQVDGGEIDQDPTELQYKALAEESLRKYSIDSGISQLLEVTRVERVTTAVVAGSLTRIDFLVSGSPDSKTIKCHSEIWEQGWRNFKEIEVSCEKDGHRGKRQIAGGISEVDPTKPQYKTLAEESLRKYMLDSGITQPLQVARIEKVTTQVVSGTLTHIDFVVSGSPDSETIKCHSKVWDRPWLNSKEINVSCQNDSQLRGKRQLVGGPKDQDPTEPRYKALAEESLRKYAIDSGITEPLKVVYIEKVTTQVVSGTVTRIDFLVSSSPDSKTIKCQSEVWNRPWLKLKDKSITVSCESDGHRGKRQVDGGEIDQDPTELQYKALAEESLRKYMLDSGITQPLQVARIEKVTTQGVSGTLTRIDFVVSGSPDSETIKCHSEIWEQGWRNFKEIEVSCEKVGHRGKRQIAGGISEVDPTKPQYKTLAEESLRKYMLDSGITQPLQVARIEKVTTQVVSGTLTHIDFVVSGSPDSETIKCHSKVWDRPWLNSKEINVSCQNDSHLRGKRQLIGGPKDQDPTEPRYKALAEESLRKYAIDSGITEPLKVVYIEKVTTQVVSGTLTRIDFLVSSSPDSKTIKCHSEVWDRPWLKRKDISITVSCENNGNIRKRQVDGGEIDQDPTELQYKALAEESLRKYSIDSGISQLLEVTRVERVTTAVVAGSLTRIDFLVSGSPDSKTIKCHSEIWEQGWRNFKEIEVSCEKDGHRGKRQIAGGISEVDPTKPQYKTLAEESLRKYMLDSGITQPLQVARIEKVTTQVVSGTLTHIDFVVSGSPDSETIKCHSKVWDRPWLNSKEINVSCRNDSHLRGKRQLVGGPKYQDPTRPQYKALAEESLRKYAIDAGITEPLKVALVEKVTTQVVSGTVTRIDFLVSGSPDSETIKCHSEVWDRPWLKRKDISITVSCDNNGHRRKRQVDGGEIDQDPTELQYKALAEESLRKYAIDSGILQPLEVARVERVTTAVVAGILTRIDFLVSGSPDSKTIKCHSEVWEQGRRKLKEIEVSCEKDGHRGNRQLVGGLTDQDPTDPKYQALAGQSLRKYIKESGITEPLKVKRVEKVSTQVVAGVLTRIDFVVSSNSDSITIICHSKILEQDWLNHKEIDVSCQDDSYRGIDGGFIDQDPTEPQYKTLAEDSLRKYVVDSGITQPLKVASVERVITQVVSRMPVTTGIDFTVSSSHDSKTIRCHSDVWEQSWLNSKKIEVSCQNDSHRGKRQISGGISEVDPTEPQYKALAEESLRKYMIDFAIAQPLEVVYVERVTLQVVEGSLTRIDFLVSGSPDSKTMKCHSEVWDRPWLNSKKIDISCQNDRHPRGNRQISGGISEVDPTEPQYKALAEESLRKYMIDFAIAQPLEVVYVERVTLQVVEGSLTRIDFLVSGSPDSKTMKCHSEVWDRPWLNSKKIDISCQNDRHPRGNRQISGGISEVDPTEPQYKALAEESLRKYMIDFAIAQPLEVVYVERVTLQVVEGSLTRIDFLVSGSPDSKTMKCHSEVWDRPWLNSKKIDISCQNDSHPRGNRQISGGISEVDPTEPQYKALAEESLRKYMIDFAIAQPLEVVYVERVTLQVVEGSLTRIDFLVSGSPDSKTMKCHSEVWDRPWLNSKKIDISCQNDSHPRGNRQISGGISEVDPTEPQYKALAEESLRKYMIDFAIALPLEVVYVERVTLQVVEGSLTRIDFLVSGSPDSKTMKCHSEVWDRPWVKEKDIKVSCLAINERVKRDLRLASGASEDYLITSRYKVLAEESIRGNSSTKGQQHIGILRGHGEEEQDPNKPEYKVLAEESLHKLYQKKSTVYHKVVEVNRVVTHVVSGLKYKIDFTAAPTGCSVNVSSVRAHSCKVDDDVLLYCHSDIWDQPWLKKKKIDIQCYGPKYDNDDFTEYDDVSLKPSDPQNNDVEKYIKLAEEASEKYLTTSNRKYVHKVTEILRASEKVADGTLTNIDYSLSPTTCLRNETTNNTSCKLKQPLVVFTCNANIRIREWLHVEKEIKVTCKKNSKTNGKKSKRESGVRNVREIGDDDDELDEDTTYYYADRAVQYLNDKSSSNNLHKLISIYAVQNSVQMGTLTVKMFIEVAETFCLRHHKSKDLRNCEEMNGLNHRLCLARLWPSPDDELVVRHVSVVCDDDEDFVSITGVNILELIRISVAALESPPENAFKLIHQGDPQVIPSLDSRRPFKLNFIVAVTNCSKDVNLAKNPFQCYVNPNVPPRNCNSYIWLKAEARYISSVDARCTPLAVARFKRSALDPENVTLDNTEIQKMVTASLEQLEMQSLHRYKQRVLQINSHSTKITSGKVTTIDFDVGYTSCLKFEWVANITNCNFLDHLPRRRCVAQISESLWISNGKNIDVNCVDDETPLESHVEFESAEMANELAKQALKHIEAKYPHPSKQTVVRIFSLEKQVVAGIHYKMKIEVGYTDCLALSDQKDCKLAKNHAMNKFCRVNVWIRPWTDHPPNFRVTCDFQEGTTRELYHHVQAEHLFYNFLTTYNPSYVNNYSQMHKRFEIFKKNVKKIHELNIHEKGTAVYGVTRFTDLSYEEFSSTYMGLKMNLTNENQVPIKQADIPNIKVPPNFDWRDYDAVTDVKDQGSCGSCWAFSVTGNIEGQWKMQSGQLVSLSEQELVDCDKLDDGCNGGLPDNAYRAIEQMGGLELESDYPYEGTDDKCAFNKTLAKVQISSAVNITTNETGMAQWLVHNGPISIGINANAMQFYMGGISHPWKMLCNPTNLDHGVLIVGFGVKDYPLFHKQLPYWTIKNSWGKSWGEQGYYRVYRGDGTCGVNQMASSAVI